MYGHVLDSIPLPFVFVVTILGAFQAIEAGYRFCRYRHGKALQENEAAFGAMSGSSLGLLAFMLAFTFGQAAERFDERLHLVLEDANAIRTAYARCDFVPDPQKSRLRELLRQYVWVRIKGKESMEALIQAMNRSEELQVSIWEIAAVIAQERGGLEVTALFLDSINNMFDVHHRRMVTSVEYRIPADCWTTLALLALFAFAGSGCQCGFVRHRSTPGSIMLVMSFSIVILLIADLDRPRQGFLQVSQQPMIDLQERIGLPHQ